MTQVLSEALVDSASRRPAGDEKVIVPVEKIRVYHLEGAEYDSMPPRAGTKCVLPSPIPGEPVPKFTHTSRKAIVA